MARGDRFSRRSVLSGPRCQWDLVKIVRIAKKGGTEGGRGKRENIFWPIVLVGEGTRTEVRAGVKEGEIRGEVSGVFGRGKSDGERSIATSNVLSVSQFGLCSVRLSCLACTVLARHVIRFRVVFAAVIVLFAAGWKSEAVQSKEFANNFGKTMLGYINLI